MPVKKIMFKNETVAIVVRSDYKKDGLSFFTPENSPLQLGVHVQKKGFTVEPHRHIAVSDRLEIFPQELFHVLEGAVRVNLFNEKEKIASVTLKKGDTILVNSGHSISFLRKSKMLIVKQGPYKNFSKEFFKAQRAPTKSPTP